MFHESVFPTFLVKKRVSMIGKSLGVAQGSRNRSLVRWNLFVFFSLAFIVVDLLLFIFDLLILIGITAFQEHFFIEVKQGLLKWKSGQVRFEPNSRL